MTKFERQRRRLLTAIVVLSMILVSLCGVVYAKYVQTDTFSDTIKITADIGTIVLQEHEAVRQTDGSYILTDTVVASNTYKLIPGLDIPKDPHVVITKPNDMPVYVYVEVVDGLDANSGISYTLAGWTELVGVIGPNGGKIYYYNTSIVNDQTIYILSNNKVEVSQNLDKNTTGLELTFYAYMYQTAAGSDAAAVYEAYNP